MAKKAGWQNYVVLTGLESTYGTNPASGHFQVPYAQCDIHAERENREAATTMGIRQRRYLQPFRRRVMGNLTCPLYGHVISTTSIAERLLTWAFNQPAGLDLDSRTLELYDVDELKRYTGVRVNQVTLTGNAESGEITLALALIGKDEAGVSAGSAQSLVATYVPERSEALFQDCTFTLGGTATAIAAFQLSFNNNLSPYFDNSGLPLAALPAGERQCDFEVTLLHEATTRDAIIRTATVSEIAAVLVLKGLHNGTGASGNYTTMTAGLDRLSFKGMTKERDRNGLTREKISYSVLKPDTTDNEIDWTFGLAS